MRSVPQPLPTGPCSELKPCSIALIKSENIAKKILTAMHLPTEVPELHPARPPPGREREWRDAQDWVN